MSFLIGAAAIIGILFMLTFMFIGIWLFIIALKTYSQLRYKNYILEKMNQKLDKLCKSNIDFSFEDFLNDKENPDSFKITDLDELDNANNVKEFEKREFEKREFK